jgi:hypothetical protein
MFGGLHPSRLVENNIMSILLMIIVSLPRPIRSNSSLTCFKNFINFKTLLSTCLIEKFFSHKQIGVENIITIDIDIDRHKCIVNC